MPNMVFRPRDTKVNESTLDVLCIFFLAKGLRVIESRDVLSC